MLATKKQLELIEDIQEFVNEKFTGTSKEEARIYISKHIKEYKLKSTDNWVIINGYD